MTLHASTPDAFRLLLEGSLALAEIERNGIRIDTDYLDQATKKVAVRIKNLQEKMRQDEVWAVWQKVCREPNMGSRTQLAKVLFQEMKFEHPGGETKTGRLKTDGSVLEKIDQPFVKRFLRVEKLKKAKSTYLDGLKREVVDGFVHPNFNLHLVDTYRSCLAKGTLIEVVRDVSKHPKGIPIENVKGGDLVYCYDDDRKLTIRKVLWAGKTGSRSVIRLHWSACGKKGYLDLTPEHKVRMASGEYVRADRLGEGDYRSKEDSPHCPKVRTLAMGRDGDCLWQTGRAKVLLDHRLIYKKVIGRLSKDEVVHHKDGNHLNNLPSNLERMSKSQHSGHHAPSSLDSEARKRSVRQRMINHSRYGDRWSVGSRCHNWISLGRFQLLRMLAEVQGSPTKLKYDYETVTKKARNLGIDLECVRCRYDKDGGYISLGRIRRSFTGRVRDVVNAFGINYKKAESLLKSRGLEFRYVRENRNPWGRAGKPNNHKIIKVERIDKLVDVYDLEVEEFHNFIANEICVHNSSDSPNVQNQPTRDPMLGEMIRRCYIPRKGNVLLEIDYSALEFRVASCFWKDPEMVRYVEEGRDPHRDFAALCYKCKKEEVSKETRFFAKNQFVFPVLYGSYYKQCAKNLWQAIDDGKLKVNGVLMKDHLKTKGIDRLGKCDPKMDSVPGTFEHHVREVEQKFNSKFSAFGQSKDPWYQEYRRNAGFPLLTGFWLSGLFSRNFCFNAPIQGPGFHCLLWSLPQIQNQLRKRKMATKIVAEIHDSGLFDAPLHEVQDVIALARQVMTVDVRTHWPWIIVPLAIEAECTEPDCSWYTKEKIEVVT